MPEGRNLELNAYLKDLNNQDPEIRASSIIALGKTGDRNAAKYLTAILENRNEIEWVRGCAAIALGRSSGAEGTEPLVKALRDDSLLVSRAAILALTDLKWRPAIADLQEILRDQSRRELHAAVVGALAAIGGAEMVPVLVHALDDPEKGVRRNAALALGELRVTEAVPGLIDLTKDEDECVRAIAASSLGLIGDKRATEALTAALEDQSETVRTIAASSLRCLGEISKKRG